MTAFSPPTSYQRAIDAGLVGFGPFSQLQPWFFDGTFVELSGDGGPPLVIFARRQDCDNVACFERDVASDLVYSVELRSGYFQVCGEPIPFEDWLAGAKLDAGEWAAQK